MDQFKKTTASNGTVQYRNINKNPQLVSKEAVPEEVIKALDTLADGTVVNADGTVPTNPNDEALQERSQEVLTGDNAAGAKAKVAAGVNPAIDWFVKQTGEDGAVEYRDLTIGNVVVDKAQLTAKLLAKLDIVKEGTPVTESDEIVPNGVNDTPKESKAADAVKVTVRRNLLINGKAYIAGKEYSVDPGVAEDLNRMDETYNEYEKNLMRENKHLGQGAEIKAGDIQA